MAENIDLSTLHGDRGALEQALRDAGAVFKGNAIKCPFHDDQTPSASIYRGEDGAWRFKCHGCGFCEDVIGVRARAANRSQAEELKSMRPAAPAPDDTKPARVFSGIQAMLESVKAYSNVECHYVYTNPDTRGADMVVIRCRDGEGKKHFLQAKPVEGGFVMRAPAKPWPIYNRQRIREASRVIVCEGEKCVHLFHDAGQVATTSPGGAGKASYADWSPLAGKSVYLWPDNDANGISHMRDVAAELQKLDPMPSVFWLEPESLAMPAKGDIEQFLEAYGGTSKPEKAQSVQCVLDLAEPFGPSSAVRRLLEDTISGKRFAVPWPWNGFSRLTNALLPGSIFVICGDPGSAKSLFLVQAARKWLKEGIKFSLYHLEIYEEGSHLLRALAQESGCSDVLEWSWVKEHPDETRSIFQSNQSFLDSFGARLTTSPQKIPSMAELTEWVRDQARDGSRVIGIDPITAAETTERRWDDDRRFVLNCQKIMRDYGSSLVLVTHPKLNAKDGKMGDVAGGAGFSRFTQTVALLRAFKPEKDVRMKFPMGEKVLSVNRSLKILKASHGAGANVEIGFTFGAGMLFSEHGVVLKDKEKDPFAEVK